MQHFEINLFDLQLPQFARIRLASCGLNHNTFMFVIPLYNIFNPVISVELRKGFYSGGRLQPCLRILD